MVGFQPRPPNRAEPKMPVHLMKTFRVINPIHTHFRQATCQEVACEKYLHGWRVLILDEADPVWVMRMEYFQNKLTPRCDRRYREYRDEHGTRVFEFEAGQEFFASDTHQHRVAIDRPPLYVVQGGDWRGNPTGYQQVHTRPDFFIEDLGESLGKALDGKAKG